MAIELTCSQCQKNLTAKDKAAGRQIKCPSCGSLQRVPGDSAQDNDVLHKSERDASKSTKQNSKCAKCGSMNSLSEFWFHAWSKEDFVPNSQKVVHDWNKTTVYMTKRRLGIVHHSDSICAACVGKQLLKARLQVAIPAGIFALGLIAGAVFCFQQRWLVGGIALVLLGLLSGALAGITLAERRIPNEVKASGELLALRCNIGRLREAGFIGWQLGKLGDEIRFGGIRL